MRARPSRWFPLLPETGWKQRGKTNCVAEEEISSAAPSSPRSAFRLREGVEWVGTLGIWVSMLVLMWGESHQQVYNSGNDVVQKDFLFFSSSWRETAESNRWCCIFNHKHYNHALWHLSRKFQGPKRKSEAALSQEIYSEAHKIP